VPCGPEGRIAALQSPELRASSGLLRPTPGQSPQRAIGPDLTSKREPAFNAPRVVLLLIALFAAIHGVTALIGDEAYVDVLLRFAFIPARYDPASPYASDFPGGAGADAWTFLTYAFLHGGFAHLAVNSVSMLAFGSALAWRFGTWRFLALSAAAAVAGAGTHLAFHFGEPTPVIGASAAISGQMAAAMRFMFETGGPLGVLRRRGREAFSVPAEPLLTSLRRPQALIFLVFWFGTNILFGLGSIAVGLGDASVAWEAHIGGFLAGLALFPLLDPVRPRPRGPLSQWDETPDEALPLDPHRPHDGETGAAGRPMN
jgi:membrane associated rhomboid family serine protease